jgi:hypothetical protein
MAIRNAGNASARLWKAQSAARSTIPWPQHALQGIIAVACVASLFVHFTTDNTLAWPIRNLHGAMQLRA